MSILFRDFDQDAFRVSYVFAGVRGSMCCRHRPLFQFRSKRESRDFELSILVFGPILLFILYYVLYAVSVDHHSLTFLWMMRFRERGLLPLTCLAVVYEVLVIWGVLIHGKVSEEEIETETLSAQELETGIERGKDKYIGLRLLMANYLETMRLYLFALQFSVSMLCVVGILYVLGYHVLSWAALTGLCITEGYLFLYTISSFRRIQKTELLPPSHDKSGTLKRCAVMAFAIDTLMITYFIVLFALP